MTIAGDYWLSVRPRLFVRFVPLSTAVVNYTKKIIAFSWWVNYTKEIITFSWWVYSFAFFTAFCRKILCLVLQEIRGWVPRGGRIELKTVVTTLVCAGFLRNEGTKEN